MKQIIQDLKKGTTILEELPAPIVQKGHVLIKTTRSLVSLGTEKMLVEFGKAGLIAKAKQQPDKVKMVLDKMKTDGILPTLEAVFSKLNQPLPLGYCNVGKVIEVGEGVKGIKVDDRVVSNGNHAEFVCVPENLVAIVPDKVTDDEAAFAVIGAIGLQGIRLLNPTFGETIVVTGLGLIGLIASQLLKANGCNVIGIDPDNQKLLVAEKMGVTPLNPKDTDVVNYILEKTNGIGIDGVIITASSSSDEIISQSAKICRKRGRIILVGVVGLNIRRSDFYEKEITFQVSCSYGPGRYDENYEEKGHDYPIGFIRWTEKRNFETILKAIENEQLKVIQLITEKVGLNDFEKIYSNIGKNNSIASILEYETESDYSRSLTVTHKTFSKTSNIIGIIGAGNFTNAMILPCLKKLNANIKWISSAKGLSGRNMAKRFNISNVTTDYAEILEDKEVDIIFITTRHNLHASMVIDALKKDKHVFVEKPLALNDTELNDIIATYQLGSKSLTVGFNRRFAPLAGRLKKLLGEDNAPINILANMNAGYIPQNVWVQDMGVGGGRIIGEACHFIDLCSFFTNSRITNVCSNSLGTNPAENSDNMSILLRYENGLNAVINYFANGSKQYPKERIEIFKQGKIYVINNWRKLEAFGHKGFTSAKSKLDKGHLNQFKELLSTKENKSLIEMDSLVNTTRASFAAVESIIERRWIEIQ